LISTNEGLRIVAVAVLLVSPKFTVQTNAAETRVDRPEAFNNGFRDSTVEQQETSAKRADVISDTASEFRIRHVWIEVLRPDSGATRADITTFVVCESSFQPGLQSGWTLKEVVYRYVALDSAGGRLSESAFEDRITEKIGPDGIFGWWRQGASTIPLKQFEDSMAGWTKDTLYLTVGFIYLNPTSQVVPFAPSPEVKVATLSMLLLGAALTVAAPAPATAIGAMAEAVGSTVAWDALTVKVAGWMSAGKAQFGTGNDVTNRSALQNRDRYIAEGKRLWPLRPPATPPPAAPANVRIVR